jgi:hypothetical protein
MKSVEKMLARVDADMCRSHLHFFSRQLSQAMGLNSFLDVSCQCMIQPVLHTMCDQNCDGLLADCGSVGLTKCENAG